MKPAAAPVRRDLLDNAARRYYNADDKLYVVINCGEGDIQAIYGAVSEKSFDKLEKVVGNLGEPM